MWNVLDLPRIVPLSFATFLISIRQGLHEGDDGILLIVAEAEIAELSRVHVGGDFRRRPARDLLAGINWRAARQDVARVVKMCAAEKSEKSANALINELGSGRVRDIAFSIRFVLRVRADGPRLDVVLDDFEGGEIWGWSHGADAFRRVHADNQNADNLERAVLVSRCPEIRASHKRHGGKAAGGRILLFGIDRIDRGLPFPLEQRDVALHLLLAVAQNGGSVLVFLRLRRVTGQQGEQRKVQSRSHLILLSMASSST
jgi:hypothetical protein